MPAIQIHETFYACVEYLVRRGVNSEVLENRLHPRIYESHPSCQHSPGQHRQPEERTRMNMAKNNLGKNMVTWQKKTMVKTW